MLLKEKSRPLTIVSVFDPRNPKGIYLHAPSLAPIRTKIGTERELVLIMKNLQSFAVLFIFLEVRCISVEQHSKIRKFWKSQSWNFWNFEILKFWNFEKSKIFGFQNFQKSEIVILKILINIFKILVLKILNKILIKISKFCSTFSKSTFWKIWSKFSKSQFRIF